MYVPTQTECAITKLSRCYFEGILVPSLGVFSPLVLLVCSYMHLTHFHLKVNFEEIEVNPGHSTRSHILSRRNE